MVCSGPYSGNADVIPIPLLHYCPICLGLCIHSTLLWARCTLVRDSVQHAHKRLMLQARACCREAVLEAITQPSEENTARKDSVDTPVQTVEKDPETIVLA